jgi:hypothetical protein
MRPRIRHVVASLIALGLVCTPVGWSAEAAAKPHRIAPAVAPPPGGGPHAFMMTQPSKPAKPVTYDPCKRIRYVVNAKRQPAKAAGIVTSAIHSVEKYTGLRFKYLGTTSRQPSRNGNVDVGGGSYPPVLIAWTTPKRVPALRGSVAGEGGSTAVSTSSSPWMRYVTGQVTLDSADIAKMLRQPGGHAIARAIVMHELGHVVGLAHVKNRHEIMYPVNTGQTAWGPGDRTGLAIVGNGRCIA